VREDKGGEKMQWREKGERRDEYRVQEKNRKRKRKMEIDTDRTGSSLKNKNGGIFNSYSGCAFHCN